MSQKAFPHHTNDIHLLIKSLKESNNQHLDEKIIKYGYDFREDLPRDEKTILVKEVVFTENQPKKTKDDVSSLFGINLLNRVNDLSHFKKKASELMLRKKRFPCNKIFENSVSKLVR